MTPSLTKIEEERLAALHEADISAPEKFRPGSYGCHEALHVASMLTEITSTQLLAHPTILLDSDFYRRANDIHAALFDLYQAIGEKHLAGPAEEPAGSQQGDTHR
ncbi:hypothetical protein [Shinella sp.]|uniref:hypothetical protein n=1 Tax=Shinella sp. TaxID=1870904 RepID=UPI003D2B0580